MCVFILCPSFSEKHTPWVEVEKLATAAGIPKAMLGAERSRNGIKRASALWLSRFSDDPMEREGCRGEGEENGGGAGEGATAEEVDSDMEDFFKKKHEEEDEEAE